MYNLTIADISLFEYAIDFFTIYGKENYKNKKYKLSWYNILHFIIIYGYYNDYEEYKIFMDNFTKQYTETEIKQFAFKFFKKIVDNGEPISDLFIFNSDVDLDKIKEKENEIRLKMQEKKYNNTKCYKCKYFKDYVYAMDNDGIDFSLNTLLTKFPYESIRKNFLIHHNFKCLKRDEVIKNLNQFDTYPYDKELRTNKKIDENKEPEFFKYNLESRRPSDWSLKPISSKDSCKYFEYSNSSFKEFIEEYHDIQ